MANHSSLHKRHDTRLKNLKTDFTFGDAFLPSQHFLCFR